MQTKKQSAVEAVVNVAVGYTIAVISQILIFPLVGVESTIKQNLMIGVAFTGISLARTYLIRRWFNRGSKNERGV